jgi:hypothetical protein
VLTPVLNSVKGGQQCTVTVKLQVTVLVQQSVATQFTVVTVPGAKEEHEGGVQTTVTLLQQPLAAVTL